jgi:hypothetical protein
MFRESENYSDVAHTMCMCTEMMHEREHDSHNETAMEILRRGFAAGEVTKDQYEDMRKTLAEEPEGSHDHSRCLQA